MSREATRTILIVEDQPALLRLLARYLTTAGYRVLEAGSEEEAKVILRQDSVIDLIVSDISLPDASGLSAPETYRRLRPDCRMLLVSGAPPAASTYAFLAKPFTREALLLRVSQLIEQ